MFENGDEIIEQAFRDAIDKINEEKFLPHTRLEPIIERLEKCDSFQASKRGFFSQFQIFTPRIHQFFHLF